MMILFSIVSPSTRKPGVHLIGEPELSSQVHSANVNLFRIRCYGDNIIAL